MKTDDMAHSNCLTLGLNRVSMFLVKGPMKERPGSHFKLIFMAGQMMLIQCFPQKGFVLLLPFQGLALKLFKLLLLFFISSVQGPNLLEEWCYRLENQTVRAAKGLQCSSCHNLQHLTKRLANLEMIVSSVLVYSRDTLKTLVVLKHNHFDSFKHILL